MLNQVHHVLVDTTLAGNKAKPSTKSLVNISRSSQFSTSGMCYPVCGMMHINEPLLLIAKSSTCGGRGLSVSLAEWSFTICPTPYNRK